MTQNTQDKLEKFVVEHKEEFDTISPKDTLWDGIYQQLQVPSKKNSKMIFWRAAAIILFICSIGLTFYANKESIRKKSVAVVYDSEFLNTEKYYSTVINERQQLIVLAAKAYPEIESDFESDWKALDDSYVQLKADYENNQRSEILDALVQNLRSRVDLLNRQIEILESIEYEEEKFLEI